jgi:arabinofuranan 3-O-arabinosyltransferase
MARLLGADTVMVVNSHQYERFGTLRPERAAMLMGDDPPGLTRLADFGSPESNVSNRFWSADQVLAPPRPLPEISLWAVDDPAASTRVSSSPIWVRADGTGLVDAVSAGVVDGHDVTLDPITFGATTVAIDSVVVTDSSRRRAHHWRSSQEVWGATEPETGVLSVDDVYDQRLPLTSFTEHETIVRAESIEAVATGYGTELSYWPEYRPAMALDGDPATMWLVGDERDPLGHVLSVTSQEPLTSLVLERSTGRNRWITSVEIRGDDGEWMRHDLDDSTTIELSPPARRIEIRIVAIDWNDDASESFGSAVGFREVLPVELRRPEVIQVAPLDEGLVAGAFVFTRLVADPIDQWRNDPEIRITREFTSSNDLSATTAITARLSPRASSAVVAELLGIVSFGSDHLAGHQAWGSWSAHDGDPTTAWWSNLDDVRPSLVVPIDGYVDELIIEQPESSPRIRRVLVTTESGLLEEVVVADGGRISFSPVDGDHVEIIVVDVEDSTRLDRRTGRPIEHPIGITEVIGATIVALDRPWNSSCRDDLVRLDGDPVSIRLAGRIDELLLGRPFDVELCGSDVDIARGVHSLDTTSGLVTGVDVDRIVFSRSPGLTDDPAGKVAVRASRTARNMVVPPCPSTCVVEGFDGWNDGWSNDPHPSAAGRNVWVLDASTSSRDITTTWRPQSLVWIGLSLSGATLIGVIAYAVISERRRRSYSTLATTGTTTVTSTNATWSAGVPSNVSAIVGTLVTVSVALTVDPVWALIPAATYVVGRLDPRWRRAPATVGIALVVLGSLFVLAQQIRTGAEPGFGWPSVFSRAHRPVLTGLVMWGSVLALRRHDPDSLLRS